MLLSVAVQYGNVLTSDRLPGTRVTCHEREVLDGLPANVSSHTIEEPSQDVQTVKLYRSLLSKM
jgi:hypothetical protein